MTAPLRATLACGCTVEFRPGADGSAFLVAIARKAETCTMALHVEGLPVHDRRSALRPATRFIPSPQPDFEDG
jgi:hypothetical protein